MVRNSRSSIPTVGHDAATEPGSCPFVDRNLKCCRDSFTLGQLGRMMGTCFGAYGSCPLHARLARQEEETESAGSFIIITLRRSTLHEELRPASP